MADNVAVFGESSTEYNDADPGKFQLEAVRVTAGQLHVYPRLAAGENTTEDRSYGGPAPTTKLAITATGVVKATPGKYYGCVVTTALSAAAITVYDNASAASGTVIDVIPASTAAGTIHIFPAPVPCTAGIYASVAGTGTVLFLFT